MDFQVLRGLTNALLAAKKPDEVCHVFVRLKTFQKSNRTRVFTACSGCSDPSGNL